MFITQKHLRRRTFLRGLGATVALPLLDAMVPAFASNVKQSPRLGFVYVPHGMVMSRFTPDAVGAGFELKDIAKPLEPYRDRLNIVSGLKLTSAYVGESSAAANHGRSSQCWITCAPQGSGSTPTSVDQVAARQIGQDTALPSLELALEPGASIAYLTPQTPLPMEANPRVVFERLLGDGSTAAERAARQRQLSSLLDSVAGDVAALQRDLPGADRVRLDD